MPIHDFKCLDCGEISEVLLLPGAAEPPKCPECGSGRVEKMLSTFNTVGGPRPAGGRTCCGRDERCDRPPCAGSESCSRS